MFQYYLITVIVNSKDTEARNLTPYNDYDTAIRKFHEAFETVGAGSKKISAVLLDNNLNPIKHEVWTLTETPTETPAETTESEE